MEIEALVRHCVERGYRFHRDFSPGLLESGYKVLMFEGLRRDGLAMNLRVVTFKEGCSRLVNKYCGGE